LSLLDFIKRIETTRKKLNKVTSQQVHSEKLRGEIRILVEDYFKSTRPTIISDSEINFDIATVDEHLQTLLELCHKKGSVKTYDKLLSLIRNSLITIDSRIISTENYVTTLINHNQVDVQIIKTLERVLPSAALSYKQAIEDLKFETRFSWRGPATDLREALRETLDHLAPDDDVKSMTGYTQNKDTNGPTMKQKVRFILTKRGISKPHSDPAENASESVESIVGSFVRSVYTRSSISTHTPTNKNEVIRIRDFVRVVLCELLEIQT
jgi:hypothetical protein